MFDFISIISSAIAGFLSTMNVYADDISHIKLSLNDVYMVTLMTSLMMVCMYLLHNQMNIHTIIFIIIVGMSFYCIRRQVLITDLQFLRGMIPHHSMAIHMSKYIINRTYNPQIRKLAQNIIKTQRYEIDLMKKLLINSM